MAYNAELQMLREFFLFYAPAQTCYFCGKPLLFIPEDTTFGHRRHSKVWVLNFTVHHEDENRENNTRGNLKGCHSTCHRRFHKQLLIKGGANGKEKERHAQKEEAVNKEVIR